MSSKTTSLGSCFLERQKRLIITLNIHQMNSQEWLKSPEVNATAEKLTRLVNQGVLPYLRPQHWKDACSVGADNLEYTLRMILDMGKHLLL